MILKLCVLFAAFSSAVKLRYERLSFCSKSNCQCPENLTGLSCELRRCPNDCFNATGHGACDEVGVFVNDKSANVIVCRESYISFVR